MNMNDKNEFDLDFDFEKEYGISPDFMNEPEFDEDDLLREFLNDDLTEPAADADPLPEEPEAAEPEAQAEEDLFDEPITDDFLNDLLRGIGEDPLEYDTPAEEPEYAPQETAYVPEEPAFEPQEVEIPAAPVLPLEPLTEEQPQEPSPQEPAAAPTLSRAEQRRRQRMKRRRFKEVYLPMILAGISLVLMLIFVIGAVSRGIASNQEDENAAIQASKDAENAADELDQEAERLLKEAQALANSYNYQGAIDLLNTFSGELTSYPELLSAKSQYSQQLTQVKAWNDPSQITNLSFHVLIADPSRAFTNKGYGGAYNKNFVTIDEFQKILEQLYANGYVLVDLESIITETVAEDGTVTYSANTIYLPTDKKPIMLTETMVNYFNYMIDSDGDGKADAGGGGFASRLVVTESGEIKAEMVNADGKTVVGDYDFVPILETFIEAHPDFSYQGARATLAVSGSEGIFGYRIGDFFYTEKNLDNSGKQQEIEGATKVVQALREKGYTIGCYTWENLDYNAINATAIQNDLQKWFEEVKPVLGEVDVMVFARGIDLSDYGTGNKFNVLYSSGFRYFIGASTAPWAELNETYFHQKRLMVTGTNMAYAATTFTKYFNSMSILNDQRGSVPT